MCKVIILIFIKILKNVIILNVVRVVQMNDYRVVDMSNSKYIIKGIYPTIDGYYYITDKIINFTK